jgi:hypothetical protein
MIGTPTSPTSATYLFCRSLYLASSVIFPSIRDASKAARENLGVGIRMEAMEIMDDIKMDVVNRAYWVLFKTGTSTPASSSPASSTYEATTLESANERPNAYSE